MNIIKELFVPFEIAKLLKEKGFDEFCFAVYYEINGEFRYNEGGTPTFYKSNSTYDGLETIINLPNLLYGGENPTLGKDPIKSFIITAPLIQQVIEWFDTKNIHIDITPEFYKDGINWNFQVWEYSPEEYDCVSNRSIGKYGDNHEYPTRRDAELAAIEKVLKINLI